MSELIRKIKDMRRFKVDNSEHFNQFYLDMLTDSAGVPKEQQHFHLDEDVRNVEKIVIGGYGEVDGENGAGHTRDLHKASYTLHMFATKSDARLLNLQGLFGLSGDMKSILSYVTNSNQDISSPNTKPIIEDGHMVFGSVEGKSTYVEGLITNVHTKGLSYRGDITLHLMKSIGSGEKYVKPEHFTNGEPLMTDAVLFGRSMAGTSFGNKVRESMDIMSYHWGYSGIKYDTKNWLLLVKNI